MHKCENAMRAPLAMCPRDALSRSVENTPFPHALLLSARPRCAHSWLPAASLARPSRSPVLDQPGRRQPACDLRRWRWMHHRSRRPAQLQARSKCCGRFSTRSSCSRQLSRLRRFSGGQRARGNDDVRLPAGATTFTCRRAATHLLVSFPPADAAADDAPGGRARGGHRRRC